VAHADQRGEVVMSRGAVPYQKQVEASDYGLVVTHRGVKLVNAVVTGSTFEGADLTDTVSARGGHRGRNDMRTAITHTCLTAF
jgi:hypothetical protein